MIVFLLAPKLLLCSQCIPVWFSDTSIYTWEYIHSGRVALLAVQILGGTLLNPSKGY